ncbi:MAG: type I DNA topoisomerase [Candidatus Peribacteraceae bacterium]|nr:type I DNA topoisomerase [Candidatus Peribacteraceae bacterium]
MTQLVIVESPAKAKTIKRFLGKEFTVEASMGHVRDLPEGELGVSTDKDFEPKYEVPEGKQAVVKHLKELAKKSTTLWIATDEDREGEAIGWHLVQLLDPKGKADVKRIVFHEITEGAIKAAVQHPRQIDMKLVDAQQGRRVLDRLVGYTLSPFLWKKVYRGLSAGRVQSVAVRIIVDREREIKAFIPVEYWTVDAALQTEKKESFTASLSQRDGEKFVPSSKEETDTALAEIEGKPFNVTELEEKEVQRNPPAPFTTSTLQQEAARKLGFSVKQTMVVAQQLYEGVALGKGEGSAGLITYMRTDSVNLSQKALDDSKSTIQQLYGREYVLSEPRKFANKSKGAQEAHEAIRPTEIERTPESLADVLDHQQLKLYTMIWQRTMATQMPPAEFKRVGANIAAGRYTFRATGQTLLFDGYLRAYTEGKDEDHEAATAQNDTDKLLPPLAEGDTLALDSITPEQHFTKPPARYTEASLVKKLEEEGIGRPSTYAPTISTVQQRGYIEKDGRQLIPADVAFTVTDLLTEHFPDIVSLSFTADMEQKLDSVADGEADYRHFVGEFYKPFHKLVESKTKEIKKEDVLKERILGIDPATGKEVVARMGRFGPFVQLGRVETKDAKEAKAMRQSGELKTASIKKGLHLDDITLEQALAQLQFPKTLGKEGESDIIVHLGRFGPYLQWGEQTTTLPKEVDPAVVDLPQAVDLLKNAKEMKRKASEPLKTFGNDPESGSAVFVKDGRYGPYVTDGKTNASLKKDMSPDTITEAEAFELLAKKRASPSRGWKGKGRR